MKKNMGAADKNLRLVLGIIIAILGLVFQSWWGLISIILLATSFMSFCPLYVPFKITTNKEKE